MIKVRPDRTLAGLENLAGYPAGPDPDIRCTPKVHMAAAENGCVNVACSGLGLTDVFVLLQR
jgi:hypothetical protein